MSNLHTCAKQNQSLSRLYLDHYLIQPKRFKRLCDIVFSLTALILLSPLYLAIALAIKFSSHGPIFYKAYRVGLGTKKIRCWKFRTMYQDADQKIAELIKSCPEIEKEWKEFHKLKNDPRVTPIGKWLRKTSLDELPQFWNVLKGDLSVVGPRPFDLIELDKCMKMGSPKIFSVRPGITGMWQTSGRNLLSFEQRIKLEEYYVDHQSFFLDAKLFFKTFPVLLFCKGAY